MIAVLALAPGLALGSFLNVVAARVPLRRSLVRPASACMACGHELAWYATQELKHFIEDLTLPARRLAVPRTAALQAPIVGH